MSSFVTRNNSQLMLNGSTFHFSGMNIPYLGNVQNPYPNNDLRYPTFYEITDALLTAKEMGATVIRAHSIGISTGHAYAIWPQLNVTNTQAFFYIDFAIALAGQLGLKLIVPFTDDHYYAQGGKHNFTDWRGVSESAFYTNATVIADFQAYIGVILNRANQFNNGILYKNDPTILAWETGNELGNGPGTVTSTWTSSIATYIKATQGAQQLVMDGNISLGASSLALSNVDMYTQHYYPPNVSSIQSAATTVCTANKVFVIGEWDWTNNVGGTCTIVIDTTTSASGGGSNSLKAIVTTAASQDYFDQIRQLSLSLTGTHTYTISFYAKALTPYTIRVSLQQNSGSYTTYGQQSFSLTTSWVQYSFQVTVPTTDSSAGLNFNIGSQATTTWFDLMSLTDNATPGTNLLTNPSFESSSSSVSPWIVNNRSIDTQAAFISAIEAAQTNAQNIAGDLWWSLSMHHERYGFTEIIEQYSLRYPGVASNYVTTSDMQTRATALRNHADKMSGITPAHTAPTVMAPTITTIYTSANGVYLTWRGVPNALSYEVVRSTTGANGTYASIATGLTDNSCPYLDSTGTATAWYKVRAYNSANVAGAYSTACTIGTAITSQVHRDGNTRVVHKDGAKV